jgi:hypothetical protein
MHFFSTFPAKGELDIRYIEAYFYGDMDEMHAMDEDVSKLSFSPLAECNIVENSSSQKHYCGE